MPELWTIKSALEWTIGYLKRKGDPNPRLSAQWLMSHSTNLSRVELYTNYDKPLSADERAVLHDAVERRGKCEPLQYICGKASFRHITLDVEPGVLIPRPETEVLVDVALSKLIDVDVAAPCCKLYVADIGTGSGCIACSIATEREDAIVYATDISSQAICVASKNADKLNVAQRITFIQCNLGDAMPESVIGKFSLIVSNPPYIPSALLEELDTEVKNFEPMIALDGGENGLAIFEELLKWSKLALLPCGWLCVELHEDCLDSACVLAQNCGFGNCEIIDDLAGKHRVLTAQKYANK